MTDPKAQAAARLAKLLTRLDRTMNALADEVRGAGLEKHRAVLDHFKATYGLGHGDANLLAHLVRQHIAGGPPAPDALLDAQYTGRKAAHRPLYEQLAAFALTQGADVTRVVQKTGVSFRRRRQFVLLQAMAKGLRIGLNLPSTPDDPRITETRGMCSHRLEVADLDAVDDAVKGWIAAAYDAAG